MRVQRWCCFGKSLTSSEILSQRGFIFPEVFCLSSLHVLQCSVKQQLCHFIILQTAIHGTLHLEIYLKTMLVRWMHGRALSAVRAHLVSAAVPFYSSLETISTSEIWN